jgi:uncharacterized damage-inducible protein DinB
MRPSAENYADLYTMNARAIRALVRDVTEEEARRRPDGRQNPMAWIVGHIAAYRGEVLAALGGPPDRAARLKALFGKDVKSDEAAWPPVAELANELRDLHDAIVERLRALGDAAFERTTKTPGGATVPALLFLHFHESYHVGQLGYVRTWLGKPPLVPPGPIPA